MKEHVIETSIEDRDGNVMKITEEKTGVNDIASIALLESEIMEKTKRRIELVEDGQKKTKGSKLRF